MVNETYPDDANGLTHVSEYFRKVPARKQNKLKGYRWLRVALEA